MSRLAKKDENGEYFPIVEEIYQVFIQDEYNNNYYLGFYKDLNSSIEDINKFLEIYNVKIKSGDIHAYASTFGKCFDTCLGDVFEDNDDVCGVYIRGFIFDKSSLIKELEK